MLCQNGLFHSTCKKQRHCLMVRRNLFERIFGERHFSWKCFIRSAAFSLGATIFIGLLFILIWPQEFVKMKENFFEAFIFPGWWLFATLWLPLSIFIDYVSLWKTRLILRILTRLRANFIVIGILGVDFVIYSLLCPIILVIVFMLVLYIDSYSVAVTVGFSSIFTIEQLTN